MIKRVLSVLSLLLCVTSIDSNGQISNKSVSFSMLYSAITSSNQPGIGLCGEYNTKLNSSLTLSPSIHFTHGLASGEFPYYLFNRSATGADVNLLFSPFNTDKYEIRLGAGPSLNYFTGYNINDFIIADRASIAVDNGYSVPLFYPKRKLESPNYFTAGYNIMADARVISTSGWILGVRLSYHSYFAKDKIASFGFSIGHKI